MYEKYSGLPDTTKSNRQSGSRPAERADNRAENSANGRVEYVQAPIRSTEQASARRASARRAKARKRKLILGGMAFTLLALIIVAVLVLVKSCGKPVVVDPATATFRSGISINGMDVSGKTADEVRPQLEANEATFLDRIAITLSSAELNATITGAEMSATTNLDEVITQALSGGANQSYSTTVSINDAALETRIDAINQTSSKPPVDASVTMNFSSSGKPTPEYIEGTPGFGLDIASTTEMIKQTIAAGQYQTTLTPAVTDIPPSSTIADIQANFSLIAKFSTTYDFKGTAESTPEQMEYIPNRAFNVEKAAAAISKYVLKPGKTFSFNDIVGDRTVENGWKMAQGIYGGDRTTPQAGGGVCQVSTTLYNAVLQIYPYIEIVERQFHSFPSTYVDMGLDATVDTNHIDFRFKNVSDHDLYIYAYPSENKKFKSRKRDLTVVIYGTALPEGHEYKTRTVLVSEESPGPDEITETKKLYVGEEEIQAPARNKFIVDVYIDHYVNGEKVEEIYRVPGPDIYPGNPLKKKVGIMPTPTPEVSPTPAPSP
ncbi:MAG TPA: VanW family protein [Clostridia bacterium]|nr:VanW family protein [Clostridia bacterium]